MKLLMLISIYILINYVNTITSKFHTGYYRDSTNIFELHLKPDFTYTYEYKLGFKYSKSIGRWKIENNILILNSSIEDLSQIPITIKEKTKENDSVFLTILNPLQQDEIYKYQLVLNDLTFNYKNDSAYYLKNTVDNLQTIQLEFLCKDIVQTPYPLRNKLSSEIYQIKSRKSNYFIIN
jgi:hypothetical protein